MRRENTILTDDGGIRGGCVHIPGEPRTEIFDYWLGYLPTVEFPGAYTLRTLSYCSKREGSGVEPGRTLPPNTHALG